MEHLKTALKWIGIPFMALSGVIFYLLRSNQNLKDEVNNVKAESAVEQVKREIAEEKKNADEKEEEYRRVRNAYVQRRLSDDDDDGNGPGAA